MAVEAGLESHAVMNNGEFGVDCAMSTVAPEASWVNPGCGFQ